jgi:hypothetical protein
MIFITNDFGIFHCTEMTKVIVKIFFFGLELDSTNKYSIWNYCSVSRHWSSWVLRAASRNYGCRVAVVGSLQMMWSRMVMDPILLMEVIWLRRHIHVMIHTGDFAVFFDDLSVCV